MRRVNRKSVNYVPRVVRSKAPGQVGRPFVIWFARVDGNVYQIGTTRDLLAHDGNRRLGWRHQTGGDFIPQRRFRYWPTNLEN